MQICRCYHPKLNDFSVTKTYLLMLKYVSTAQSVEFSVRKIKINRCDFKIAFPPLKVKRSTFDDDQHVQRSSSSTPKFYPFIYPKILFHQIVQEAMFIRLKSLG